MSIPLRPLGRTGLFVSPIAFGAFKIGRNEKIKYAESYDLPDDSAARRLLEGVLDLGINLIDTAPAYGVSEERIGKLLAHRRGEFILSTKVGETFEDSQSTHDFSAAAVTRSVERSLRRLATDVLDIVLIHSDGNDLHILRQTDCVPALQQLRERGLVRFVGLSGKQPEGAIAAMEWADVLMVEYHPRDTSQEAVLAGARAKGVGVLVKKPLASGTLAPAETIPWILANAAVSSLVVGGLNLEHMRQNLRYAAGRGSNSTDSR
jgi:aryl-alcohol dehydrogenase-like predicted oxidoreductase